MHRNRKRDKSINRIDVSIMIIWSQKKKYYGGERSERSNKVEKDFKNKSP